MIYHSKENTIHETAYVSPNAILGKGNYIGAFTVIGPNVKIGNNNHIGSHCIIGDIPESREFFKEHSGKVHIEDNCRIYKQVTIDGATENVTVIMSNCEFLKNSHVGHDAVIYQNVSLRCNASVGGFATLHSGVMIGMNASVHQRVEIPKRVIIGMNSCVTKKQFLDENSIYGGVPVRKLKKRL